MTLEFFALAICRLNACPLGLPVMGHEGRKKLEMSLQESREQVNLSKP